jgi:hypothetical protein
MLDFTSTSIQNNKPTIQHLLGHWGAAVAKVFFFSVTFSTGGHQKIKLLRNLVNLGVFWSRFFKQNLNSFFFTRTNKVRAILTARSSRCSGNNLRGTNLRLRLESRYQHHCIFLQQELEKVGEKFIWLGPWTNDHPQNHPCSQPNHQATIVDAYILYLTLDRSSNSN